MKKLYIICSLVMVFSVAIAQAQQYEVAPCGTKDFTTAEGVPPGGTICLDIWLTDANAPQNSGGVWIDFSGSIALVSAGRCMVSGSEGCTGPWTDGAGANVPNPAGPGTHMLVVGSIGVPTDADGDLIVGTVTLQNTGPNDAAVNFTTIPGIVTWTPLIDSDVTPGAIVIEEICDCTTDADCDDGLFCNGAEICNPICVCNPGTPPCYDGDRCTLDCDEDTDSCRNDECDISELSCYTDPCMQFPPCSENVLCIPHCDADCDLRRDTSDNCPNNPNHFLWGTCTAGESHKIARPCWDNNECGTSGFCSMSQEDTDGDEIGDACEICEGDLDCDDKCDALDVEIFLGHFGRSQFNRPCTNDDQCPGDFFCDRDVDALDVDKFLEDFGRSQYNNPCPACVAGDWCVYP